MTRAGRIRRATFAIATSIAVAASVASGLASTALAAAPDKAEVVLVLDFSSSILDDATTRNQFGAALERIANRVDETENDLIKGDTTISIVQFGAKAADVPRCGEIRTLGSQSSVRHLADCLRTVAAEYRSGGNAELTKSIGRDTNYVAAMQAADKHLPDNATRPTMILFTDGKHDAPGVPVSQVQPTRDSLFGNRTPFALLPVGMGLKAAERPTLEAGLVKLKTINKMPPCSNGDTMQWPDVVFATPDLAGTAVAQALQDATCTFTVVPVASQGPQNVVSDIQLAAGDGKATVSWNPPTTSADDKIVSYRIQCTADGGGDPITKTQEPTSDNSTTVEGLTNGTAYSCEVAADTATAKGDWTKADLTVTPAPVPAAPSQPKVTAGNQSIEIDTKLGDGPAADSLSYACTPVGAPSASPATADVQVADGTNATIGGLKNGTAYTCKAKATNGSGDGALSPASDAVTPCDGVLECNNLMLPVVAGLGGLIALALLIGFIVLARNRTGSYVVAVVDTVHSANLGGGSELGLALIGGPYARQLEGIASAKGKKADVKIHKLRNDRFRVTDKRGSQEVHSGEAIVVEGRNGVRHELVLRGFEGRAAAGETVRR